MHLDAFAVIALAGAVASALILIWYLVARPQLNRVTKLALLLGIGVFPLTTAGSGNYAGFEATKHREFCGSCHVMTPYLDDATDPKSTGLAAIHTRNEKQDCVVAGALVTDGCFELRVPNVPQGMGARVVDRTIGIHSLRLFGGYVNQLSDASRARVPGSSPWPRPPGKSPGRRGT